MKSKRPGFNSFSQQQISLPGILTCITYEIFETDGNVWIHSISAMYSSLSLCTYIRSCTDTDVHNSYLDTIMCRFATSNHFIITSQQTALFIPGKEYLAFINGISYLCTYMQMAWLGCALRIL